MEKKKRELEGADGLRKKAEERLKPKQAVPEKMSELETLELVQELRVHQIELEMRNEELRRTQAVVEESRAKYSDLYDFAPVGYLTLNRQGVILEANLTACSKLGKERSLLISITLFTNFIIKKEEKDLFYQHLRKVFEAKSLETCELELKGKGNTKFYAQLESIVVKDNLSQCRTAITDITERKRAEEQLVQEKENLEKVNLELDSFVYTASHDLRAPLRSIASFSYFLLQDCRDKLNEQGKHYLDKIQNSSKRMNQLIEDLLVLSRISRIKNPYDLVDIKELIRDVIKRIEFDIRETKTEVVIQKHMPQIVCDRIKIAEVFVNLLNNAIKFSSKENPSRPRVEVGYSDENRFHQFFVKDNGIGIDPAQHEQIFGLFKRLHKRSEYEGTGAGLSIVKRVVADHGGKIWVESEFGKGAAFFFTIPKNLKVGTRSDVFEQGIFARKFNPVLRQAQCGEFVEPRVEGLP